MTADDHDDQQLTRRAPGEANGSATGRGDALPDASGPPADGADWPIADGAEPAAYSADDQPGDRDPASSMTRDDIYSKPMRAGRPVPNGPVPRIGRWLKDRFSTEVQRRERAVDAYLQGTPPLSYPNTISVISPKGGVGKTTISFVLGNLLASELKLRVIALDANPDFGTLASLTPDGFRSTRSLADLLADCDQMTSPAELHPYVSRLPTGLHVLGAPAHAEVMAQMTPGLYARLLDFLERFYEILILDLGTGITDPLAQFAIERATQTIVITTPEWITAAGVLGALRYLQLKEGTLVLNQAPVSNSAGNRKVIEENFRRQAVATSATIPYDPRLRTKLDTGTYDLSALKRSTRVPVKELAAALTNNFV